MLNHFFMEKLTFKKKGNNWATNSGLVIQQNFILISGDLKKKDKNKLYDWAQFTTIYGKNVEVVKHKN